jgi:hypothetical protein
MPTIALVLREATLYLDQDLDLLIMHSDLKH